MAYIGYGLMIIGALSAVIGSILIHRKGEAEVSRSLGSSPAFLFGIVALLIGVIVRIIATFIH